MPNEDSSYRLNTASRLEIAICKNLKELYQLNKRQSLASVAWCARNALELMAWVQYCQISEENAERFTFDAARDARQLLHLSDEMYTNDTIHAVRDELDKLAIESGFTGITDKYIYIGDAAQKGDITNFSSEYKTLSKFAHATSMMIMTEMSDEETKGWKTKFFEAGLTYSRFAQRSIALFRETVSMS